MMLTRILNPLPRSYVCICVYVYMCVHDMLSLTTFSFVLVKIIWRSKLRDPSHKVSLVRTPVSHKGSLICNVFIFPTLILRS